MESKEEKNEARFIGLTQNAWLIFTIIAVVVTVAWMLFERSQGNPPFEPTLGFLAIVIELVLGLGGYYQARREKREGQKELSAIKDQITLETQSNRNVTVQEGQATRQEIREFSANIKEDSERQRELTTLEHDATRATVTGVGEMIVEKLDGQSVHYEELRTQQRREYKSRLINQLKSQVPDVAKAAISELNANGWFADGSLNDMDFVGANWQGADLKATTETGAHTGAVLRRVRLKQANLQSTDMREIDLSNANLHMANLRGAMLSDSDLSFADLALADLSGTNLYRAKLTGANFAGAICDENTRLPDGKRWSLDVDWNKFDAIEEDPTSTRVPKKHHLAGDDLILLDVRNDGTTDVVGTGTGVSYSDYIVYETASDSEMLFRVVWVRYNNDDLNIWNGLLRSVDGDELPD